MHPLLSLGPRALQVPGHRAPLPQSYHPSSCTPPHLPSKPFSWILHYPPTFLCQCIISVCIFQQYVLFRFPVFELCINRILFRPSWLHLSRNVFGIHPRCCVDLFHSCRPVGGVLTQGLGFSHRARFVVAGQLCVATNRTARSRPPPDPASEVPWNRRAVGSAGVRPDPGTPDSRTGWITPPFRQQSRGPLGLQVPLVTAASPLHLCTEGRLHDGSLSEL